MKKSVIVILHLGYWILYLLLLSTFFLTNFEAQSKFGSVNISYLAFSYIATTITPAIFGFYLFYTHLFSKYLAKKKIGQLFLWGILISFVGSLIGLFGNSMANYFIRGFDLTLMSYFQHNFNQISANPTSYIALIIVLSINTLFNGGMGLIIKGFTTWYADIKVKEELNKRNYETELELIKSQINPHFLFNTINNIDVLIEKDASKASAYLNKLSDIMRFMLYETKTEEIPLKKELDYIEKYIELQKIRTSNPDFVQLIVTGNPDDKHIAPMLLIPFIENAFKYAEQKKTGNAIAIIIKMEKDKLIFDCENHYAIFTNTELKHGGLGNELIKKRLQLLYPNKHVLEITNINNVYKVKLIITEHD